MVIITHTLDNRNIVTPQILHALFLISIVQIETCQRDHRIHEHGSIVGKIIHIIPTYTMGGVDHITSIRFQVPDDLILGVEFEGLLPDLVTGYYADGGCRCIVAVTRIPFKVFRTVLKDPRESIRMIDTVIRDCRGYCWRILYIGIFKVCSYVTDPVLHVRAPTIVMIFFHGTVW